MRQGTLSDAGFEKYRKRTRKEKFLEEMERIVPWGKLVEVIEPYYPKPEGAAIPIMSRPTPMASCPIAILFLLQGDFSLGGAIHPPQGRSAPWGV